MFDFNFIYKQVTDLVSSRSLITGTTSQGGGGGYIEISILRYRYRYIDTCIYISLNPRFLNQKHNQQTVCNFDVCLESFRMFNFSN